MGQYRVENSGDAKMGGAIEYACRVKRVSKKEGGGWIKMGKAEKGEMAWDRGWKDDVEWAKVDWRRRREWFG